MIENGPGLKLFLNVLAVMAVLGIDFIVVAVAVTAAAVVHFLNDFVPLVLVLVLVLVLALVLVLVLDLVRVRVMDLTWFISGLF